jgi:transcriptional regulator with XRE-family HTH domain
MGRESVSAVFARVLRREREAQRLSQEALAHRAGVHRTYVGLVERGLRKPTIEVGHALARALGTPLSDLIREAERRLQRGG